jgi:hypothetical protein
MATSASSRIGRYEMVTLIRKSGQEQPATGERDGRPMLSGSDSQE